MDLRSIKEKLGSGISLNWDRILSSMQALGLKEGERSELTINVVDYINGVFRSGHFTNLEGIKPVLDFLEIDEIKFTTEHVVQLHKLLARHSLSFLYSMSPTLWNGKLRGGKPYDRVEYTRELLQKKSAPPEELTDEYIKALWDARETLVKLHHGGYDGQQQLSPGMGLLEFTRKLT